MKKVWIFFLFGITTTNAFSQISKVGFFAGVSNYSGELGSISNGNLPAFGMSYKYQFKENLSFIEPKISIYYGKVSGDDNLHLDIYRQTRNLHFKSNIIEFNGQLQIGLPFNKLDTDLASYRKRFAPFSTVGFSIFRFNPKAEYVDGEWYELQPLGTEGQGINPTRDLYSRVSVAFNIGLGIKFKISKRAELEIDYTIRFTRTDYLDDVSTVYPDNSLIQEKKGDIAAYFADRTEGTLGVSQFGQQRGDATDNDIYIFKGVTLYYYLNR